MIGTGPFGTSTGTGRAVVEFCRQHDVAIVIEPGKAGTRQVDAVLEWLVDAV